MFLIESFPFRPVKRYILPSCFSAWSCNSSVRNSGMLKILSLFPFACLMCPIFSEKFKLSIFRLISSETRNPHAYIRLIISLDFWVWSSSKRFLISFFDRIVGRRFSFLGRLIVAVMSLFRIVVWEYLIEARKRIVDVAALSTRFFAMKDFTSSVVIWLGDFFVNSRRSLFALR